MPTSDQYKLLRNGGVRTSTARAMSRSGRYNASPDVLAPKLDEFGHRRFGEPDLQALAQRLQDSKWPRDTLSIYGLEGLLTALLVLPIGLQPGAWLPLIWNQSGWKIPAVLQGEDRFNEFIELVIGFMRAIDSGFLETPPRFASALDTLDERYRPKTPHAHQDWARGFGLAVNQSNFLKILPDSIAHRTLYIIATHAHPTPASIQHRNQTPPQTLQQAVLALANARIARGPLGPLPARSKNTSSSSTRPNLKIARAAKDAIGASPSKQ